ncbi:MAG: bifunctional (p)ppGpp synthetase/guanosine-3',5'-bis(diphosphate) 3'-pyrophosphohydrolase [Pseudomonadota bacterium]
MLDTYLEPQQVKEVYRAYLLSAEAHDGQTRKSGEPYISHPLAAAYILGQMQMDTQTLCAALLHDVIEDTEITKEQLVTQFGEKVAELVDGVSKISSMQFENREQAQAASFQKMLLAMNHDIRVIIVKLADRLHNMRTLGAMKGAARRRIACETLEIYAPIANRLGMNAVRIELQELSFAMLYPLRYRVLTQWMQKLYDKQAHIFHTIKSTIEENLIRCHIHAQIFKRKKHSYAIYSKMREKKGPTFTDKRKTFYQATNFCAFRIITKSVDDCYRLLGIVHNLYKPKYEFFKDYIAIPKINGYQSLHTVLFSSHGVLIDIQIRTSPMHELAEKGITAYQLYQSGQEKPDCQHKATNYLATPPTHKWLHNLLDIQQSASDLLDFLKHVKTDLFPDEVYVFTPKGKIIQLPKNATAIDFAYAIHSEVGNHCIRVKIDSLDSPLSTLLVSGQTVEVLTEAEARPKRSWLNFAISARARYHIRHFFKNLQYDEAVLLGKRLLDRELAAYALSVDKLSEEQRACLVTTLKVDKLDTLLHEIGLGNRMAWIVLHHLRSDSSTLPVNDKPLMIKGTDGILVNLSHCCRPIPGDDIVGFVSAGRGILIHTAACKQVARHQPDKLLAVEWESRIEGEFLVDICVDVRDRPGVLAGLAMTLANMDINIEHVSNENKESGYSTLKFCIYVQSRDHLALIMRHLRRMENVIRIRRSKN